MIQRMLLLALGFVEGIAVSVGVYFTLTVGGEMVNALLFVIILCIGVTFAAIKP